MAETAGFRGSAPWIRPWWSVQVRLRASRCLLRGHNYAEEPFSTIGAERVLSDAHLRPLPGAERDGEDGPLAVPQPVTPSKRHLAVVLRPPAPPCAACGTGLPCGPKRLVVGRRARIVRLGSAAGQALNGQDCVVESYMEEPERYAVRVIDSSAVKALKPAGALTRSGIRTMTIMPSRPIRIFFIFSKFPSWLQRHVLLLCSYYEDKSKYSIHRPASVAPALAACAALPQAGVGWISFW